MYVESDSDGLAPAAATAALEALVSEIAELRTPPAVALQVIEIASGERFSAPELARVISTNPVLTAKVLRLSNSAYYGYARTISTVRDAVVLLGFRAVRSAALASCVIDVLPRRATSLDPERFWHFSVTVGALAELLGQAGHDRVDEAFTAGVLHNIGRLALDQHRPLDLTAAAQLAAEQNISIAAAQNALFGFTDAQLGAALARRWNFPDELVDAVAQHQLNPVDLTDQSSLATLVVRARAFAHGQGLSDGVERPVRQPADALWLLPPLTLAIGSLGGIEGIDDRVAAFVASTFHTDTAAAA